MKHEYPKWLYHAETGDAVLAENAEEHELLEQGADYVETPADAKKADKPKEPKAPVTPAPAPEPKAPAEPATPTAPVIELSKLKTKAQLLEAGSSLGLTLDESLTVAMLKEAVQAKLEAK